jgi:hypothetical protein
MTDELVETVEQKLARYETVIGLQMEEIDRLRAPTTLIQLCAACIWMRHSLQLLAYAQRKPH